MTSVARRLVFLILAILVFFLLTKLPNSKKEVLTSAQIMGTSYSVKYLSNLSAEENNQIKEEISLSLKAVDEEMSTYKPNSWLSKFNNSKSTEFQSAPEKVFKVFEISKDIFEKTNGAFDPSVSPLVELWGFGAKEVKEKAPSKAQIDKLKEITGFSNITLDKENKSIKKNIPELKITFSSVAKGFAVDLAGKVLESRGINDYLVEIGGEVRARGKNKSGEFWKVAIEKPSKDMLFNRKLDKILSLENISLATSGTYRNYFEDSGKSYSHTLNPKTGWPVSHNTVSVSVLHEDCAAADAYATAFLVLGKEEGFRVAEELGVAAVFIESNTEKGAFQNFPTSNYGLLFGSK